MKKTGVIIEVENGVIKDANFGMITLAGKQNTELYAIITASEQFESKEKLEQYGVSGIISIKLNPEQANNPVIKAKAIENIIKTYNFTHVFGLSSAYGKDLLPRIAALTDAPLVMDCVDVDCEQDIAVTSQYSGKTQAKIKMTGNLKFFGIRPNAVDPVKDPVVSEYFEFDGTRTESEGFRVIKSGGSEHKSNISLTEADIIVAGGRGLSGSENFTHLTTCADKLGASVAASRVAVDSGWVPYSMQVGQTGEKVSPKVYIAFGISGSIQHFAGMKTSGMVIAVNTDKNASIISNCDYYAVADAMEIITELTKLMSNAR